MGGTAQVVQGPPLAFQNLTIGSLTSSSGLGSATRIMRVKAEGDCYIAFGPSPQTATNSSMLMQAGDTEYFGVSPGDIVSVLTV